MTDISRIASAFPYEHECNPARLFEAIQRGDDFHVTIWYRGFYREGPIFTQGDRGIFHAPLDISRSDYNHVVKLIMNALYRRGYKIRVIHVSRDHNAMDEWELSTHPVGNGWDEIKYYPDFESDTV